MRQMADSGDYAALSGEILEGPAGRVLLSREAQQDLQRLGRPIRAIVSRTMRDELLEPTGAINVKPAGSPPGEGQWYELPIGNFRVVFRALAPGPGGAVADRLVGRIERVGRGQRLRGVVTGEPSGSAI
jgi:mRNA-degrading endonuclease RelE of RelBE toxin-antitoxin system